MPTHTIPDYVLIPHREAVAVGAVVQFISTDKERIQDWLDRAYAAGIIKRTTAHEFDPAYGGPVWYIP